MTMPIGRVKFFNGNFGFIQAGDGTEVHVHSSQLEKAGIATLTPGQVVRYEPFTNVSGRTAAENLQLMPRARLHMAWCAASRPRAVTVSSQRPTAPTCSSTYPRSSKRAYPLWSGANESHSQFSTTRAALLPRISRSNDSSVHRHWPGHSFRRGRAVRRGMLGMRPMKRQNQRRLKNLHLRPDLLDALHELAATEGVPVGVLIATLLAEALTWRLSRK
jgi:cold shock protein